MVIFKCDSLVFEFDMEGQKPDTRESLIKRVFWLVLTQDLLEDRRLFII